MLTSLIWGRGRRRVALRKLKLPLAGGGMAMSDFELYDRAPQTQWVTRQMAEIRKALEVLPDPVGQLIPVITILWHPSHGGRNKPAELSSFRY